MNREDLIKNMEDKRALFGLFFAFGNRLQAAGDNFYDEITCKQFFLLICLSLFDEQPTINELSDVMGSSHQNVKQIINKLSEKGFVKMISDKNDKRKVRIQKTDKMDELKHKYQQQEIQFMQELYDGVEAKEVAITLSTIQKLENNLIDMKEKRQ